jgi:WD40 repeat protein
MKASSRPMYVHRRMRWRRARFRSLGRDFLAAGLVVALMTSKAHAAQEIQTDLYGDPLPLGAVARLGTLRDNIGEMSGDIVLSPDGKTITATSAYLSIPLRLWDVETGRAIRHLKELEPPATYAHVRRVAFSADGKLLAAGDSLGTVRIGSTTTGRKIRELAGPLVAIRELAGPAAVGCLTFLPDANSLAVAYMDGAIWLYRLSTGERIRSLAVAPFYFPFFNVFSPDGKVVSVRRLDDSLSLRDVLTGREIHRLGNKLFPHATTARLGGQPPNFTLGDGQLRALSPDGRLLAVAGRNASVRLWAIAAAREIRCLSLPPPPRRRRFSIDIDHSLESHLVFSRDDYRATLGGGHGA